jgi:hypothetical protein
VVRQFLLAANALKDIMVIVTQKIGRLGNQVYLFAHLIALYCRTGIGLAHPALGEYGLYFVGTRGDPLCRFPPVPNHLPSGVWARKCSYYLARLFDHLCCQLHRSDNWFRIDYREEFDLSNPTFVEQARANRTTFLSGGWRFQFPEIDQDFFIKAREFFALAQPYADHVNQLVARAREDADVLVGVHIRQTDFKDHAEGKFYFSTEQYADVMRKTAKLLSERKIHFLVVSDEPKSSTDFPGLHCTWGTGMPVEDMYALGACDYVISCIASSFSLWPTVLYQIPNYRVSDPEANFTMEDFRILHEPWTIESKSI